MIAGCTRRLLTIITTKTADNIRGPPFRPYYIRTVPDGLLVPVHAVVTQQSVAAVVASDQSPEHGRTPHGTLLSRVLKRTQRPSAFSFIYDRPRRGVNRQKVYIYFGGFFDIYRFSPTRAHTRAHKSGDTERYEENPIKNTNIIIDMS